MNIFTENLIYLYCLPFLLSLYFSVRKYSEKHIYRASLLIFSLCFLLSLFQGFIFFQNEAEAFEFSLGEIHFGSHHFSFNFFIDELTIAINLITGYLSILITKFARVYLHREFHYQRFFRIINLFVFGLNLLAMAGTLDLFFAGWELIGLSSFLLIGYYHDRTRPARNAFRIFSIYRLCDVGLLFGAIVGHIALKDADHFYFLLNQSAQFVSLNDHLWISTLAILLIIAAIGKSAQFPFINWPSRALEGPTPSSALFYGSLSIHCGVFLLYRTYPLYSHMPSLLILIFLIGLLSFLLATGIGRVQANIKGQIAYASVAQIGLMFMELALGLKWLVLIHFICHSFLRCYQILISSSVLVEHLKEMVHPSFIKKIKPIEYYLPLFLRKTFYVFAMQEGFLSISERGFFPVPLIKIKIWARKHKATLALFCALFALMIGDIFRSYNFTSSEIISYFFAFLNLLVCIYCMLSLKSPKTIWIYFIVAQLFFVSANFVHDPESIDGILLYLVSAIPLLTIGYYSLAHIPKINLKRYNGLYHSHRFAYRLFVISFIGLAGYPLTTIFWAEDLIFAEIFLDAPAILFLTALSFMLNGFIVGRILVKTFWGYPAVTWK